MTTGSSSAISSGSFFLFFYRGLGASVVCLNFDGVQWCSGGLRIRFVSLLLVASFLLFSSGRVWRLMGGSCAKTLHPRRGAGGRGGCKY